MNKYKQNESILDIFEKLPATNLLIEQCQNLDSTLNRMEEICWNLHKENLKLLGESIQQNNKIIELMTENNRLNQMLNR